jgi:oligopeptide transport system substrate-binding protein
MVLPLNRQGHPLKAVLIALLLALCCCQEESSVAPKGRSLRLNLFHEPPTLDPRQTRDIASDTVILMLYEGLTRLDGEGRPVLAAAERFVRSEDGRVYLFRLKEAMWSNGDRVTADDFVEGWKLSHLSGRPELLGPIAAVRAIEPSVLEVELREPVADFLTLLATPNLFPYHGGATNGPFELDGHVLNQKLVVVKSPSYWDAANVHLPAIEMCIVDDQKTELLMFEQGELDWAGRPNSVIPLDALRELRAKGSLRSHPVDKVYWYQFNPEVEPFNNQKVRRAFSMAIDRERIIQHVTCGSHRPATGLLPTSNGEALPYDPEGARQLLAEGIAELGLESCPPVVLAFNNGEDHLRISQAVQREWQRTLGVEVELDAREFRVHFDRLERGDYQVARFGWECAFPDGSDILDYVCRTYDLPPETTEEQVLEQMLVAPLFFYNYDHLCHEGIREVVFPSNGRVDFRWAQW